MTRIRVNEIDLLRFFAVLGVIFFHYAFRGYAADDMTSMSYSPLASVARYGYLGVDLFFMISGFVILMTAAKGNLRAFVISRIVRLYPAFWACCTATFFTILAIGGQRYSATLSQYFTNMTMLSGFVGVPEIDGAYWSLFIELRFYLLIVIMLLMKKIHHAQAVILLWLVASIALEFHHSGRLCTYLITDYSAYFIAGATYYLIWSKGLTFSRIALVVTSWGLALYHALKMVRMLESNYHTTMSNTIVVGMITGFYVVMMLIALKRTGWIGRKRWVFVGALTYPLYLLHQNIGFMLFNVAYPALNKHLVFWGTIATVMVLAYMVHVLVEKRCVPVIKKRLNRLIDGVQGLREMVATTLK